MHKTERTARAFIRHPSDIPIEIGAEMAAEEARRRLNNVSLGGLSCECALPLERGALVRIRIPVVRPAFETEGQVAWCRRRHGHFEVGVQFTEGEDAFRARMVEQICHIEHYRNEVREKEGRVLDGEAAALEWIGKFAGKFPGQFPDPGRPGRQ
jgi:PilZ domain-containing protein